MLRRVAVCAVLCVAAVAVASEDKGKEAADLPKVCECGADYFRVDEPRLNGKPFDANKPVVLKIVEPAEGQSYPAGTKKIGVKFRLENYDLPTEEQFAKHKGGNHVHVILDNNPYAACYDVGKPFEIDVADGAHVLRAFPSRPWHESWKNDEAFAMVRFTVGADDGKHKVDPKGPVLTYSRPKGSYTIDKNNKAKSNADEVLFDFWAKNIDWSTQRPVVEITGPDGKKIYNKKFSKWDSDCIKGKFKKAGAYKVTFKLLDKDGKEIDNGGLNSTERTINIVEVDASAAPAAPVAAPAVPAAPVKAEAKEEEKEEKKEEAKPDEAAKKAEEAKKKADKEAAKKAEAEKKADEEAKKKADKEAAKKAEAEKKAAEEAAKEAEDEKKKAEEAAKKGEEKKEEPNPEAKKEEKKEDVKKEEKKEESKLDKEAAKREEQFQKMAQKAADEARKAFAEAEKARAEGKEVKAKVEEKKEEKKEEAKTEAKKEEAAAKSE
ncbi:MAG: hypothetical protein L6R28_13560 [Planctomycetes bacterium]|nr:hypothetical protein [Planctomycetota bacterium]